MRASFVTRSPFRYAADTCAVLFCLFVSAISCRGQEMVIYLEGRGAAMIPPAELLVTDSLGRRFGYDPSTGSMVREIPEMAYFREALDVVYDPETGEGGPETITLYFGGPADGAYQLTLTGVRRGEFTMEFYWYDREAPHRDKKITGETFRGRIYRYRIEYVRDNAAKTLIVPDTYRFLGFSSPLGANDSRCFKLGSTIPVKFQMHLRDGRMVPDVTAKFTLQPYSNGRPMGEPIGASSTGEAGCVNVFRYDREANQYVYFLSTTPLSVGTWKLIVTLDDGSAYDVLIGLK